MNALLADPDQVNVARLLADGRIGLFVVSQLARRHGITVRLQTNIYGGVQAVLVVPQALLGAEAGAPGGHRAAGGRGGRHGSSGRTAAAGRAAGTARAVRRWSRSGSRVRGRSRSGLPEEFPGRGGCLRWGRSRRPVRSRVRARGRRLDGVRLLVRVRCRLRGTAARPAVRTRRVPSAPAGSRTGPGRKPEGGRPTPLPVRGTRRERPNPAEARPGDQPRRPARPRRERGHAAHPAQRRRARHHGQAPTAPPPRPGAHRTPTARRPGAAPGTRDLVGHDPGLMAAFQRGIGLAEAQQHMEAGNMGRATWSR